MIRRGEMLLALGVGLAALAGPVAGQVPPLPPPAPLTPDVAIRRPPPEPSSLGYPDPVVDRAQILSTLRARRFGDLERLLGRERDRMRRDIRREELFVAAFGAFEGPERDIGPFLEEWVRRRPGSADAHIARGRFFRARFWDVRGTGYACDLEEGQRRAMQAHLDRATRDAWQAIDLDQDNLAGHLLLIDVLLPGGWSDEAEAALARALKRFPTSYMIRARAMVGMEPRWGGSYARMEALGEQAQPWVAKNPRLAVLRGAALREQARLLRRDKKWADALAKLDEAAAFGTDWWGHAERGRVWYYAGDYVRALEAFNEAVAQRPSSGSTLSLRGRTLSMIAQALAPPERRSELLEAAEVDLADALRVDPGDADSREWLDWVKGREVACARSPATCLRAPTASGKPDFDPETGEPRSWLLKALFFMVGIPYTLYMVLVESNQMGLGPTPLVAFGILAWSFVEWARQRFWTPPIVHVMVGLAVLVILGINAAWISVGGTMWTQRFVVIAICGMVPYVVYLLFLGPRFLGRRRKR